MHRVCICILSPQSYFKGTEGAEVSCDKSGWQLRCLFTNLLVLHTCLPLCLVLVSNLHGTLWLSRRGRVAFQVSRWKQATHHLVLGEKGGEREREHSLPAQLVGFWPTTVLNLYNPPPTPTGPLFPPPSHSDQPHSACLTETGRGPSPVEANRGREDEGRAGEKEHSGKQQHLLSCICLSLASYGVWQLEMHVVHSAIPDMDVESSQMAVTFFLPTPCLSFSFTPSVSISSLLSPPPVNEGQPLWCDFEECERTIGLTSQWPAYKSRIIVEIIKITAA